MKLILVRHGETAWNLERRYQGQLDIPLNSKGEWQARQAARALAGRSIDHLFSSDLRRARDTAQVIAGICKRPLTTDPRLREIGFGSWEGLSLEQIMERDGDAYRRWRENPIAHAPTGGETLAVTQRRVLPLLEEIAGIGAQTIVIVSHGGTLRILLTHLLQLPPQAFWQMKLDNAGLSLLELCPAGNSLISLNDTRHLGEKSNE